MSVVELRVKIGTLASVSRIIRREERRALTAARIGNIRARLRVAGLDNNAVDRIVARAHKCLARRMPALEFTDRRILARVYESTPSLAKALRVGPCDMRDAFFESYQSLRRHRVHDVRREARDSLLAYAMLRGVSYEMVEAPVKSLPNWENVVTTAVRFGAQEAASRAWVEVAKSSPAVKALVFLRRPAEDEAAA